MTPRPFPISFAPHQGKSVMNEPFQALAIDQRHAFTAYPLVFMHDASITTEQWLSFVRQRCAGESGLIGIHDRRGIVHALFSYRVDNDLRIRRRLCIGDLIVAQLPGTQIDSAIATAAADVSARFGCQSITIERPFPTMSAAPPRCPTAIALRRRAGPFH